MGELEGISLEATGLRGNHSLLASELSDVHAEGTAVAAQLTLMEGETKELHMTGVEISSEVARARGEEALVQEEAVLLQHECKEEAVALRRQRVMQGEAMRVVNELESVFEAARQRVLTTEKEAHEHGAEMEERCCMLQNELKLQSAVCAEVSAHSSQCKSEEAELAAHTAKLARELETGEATEARLQAALAAAIPQMEARVHELRAQRAREHELAAEVASNKRKEETLRDELADERCRAQEASRITASLLEQRRRVSDEADEALRRCNTAFVDSWTSAQVLQLRDEQIAQSTRSCQLMRNTLGQHLAAVHEQVKEAETAHTQAVAELREERREHQQLRTHLLHENARRRARLLRPLM